MRERERCESTAALQNVDHPEVSAVLRCDLPLGHRGRHHAHVVWAEAPVLVPS